MVKNVYGSRGSRRGRRAEDSSGCVANDAERSARFKREAHLLATLAIRPEGDQLAAMAVQPTATPPRFVFVFNFFEELR